LTGERDRSEPAIECRACTGELAELVEPRAAVALRNLDLTEVLSGVLLCIDELPDGDDGWLRLDPAAGGGPPVLTVFCAATAFTDRPRAGNIVDPAPEVWEQFEAPRQDESFLVESFSPAETNAFLHHQFALVHDLMRSRLTPGAVPAGQAQAFTAVWDVVIDGDLERRGLPGFSLAVRRSRFSRLFSAAGVLLPGHWQIFQALWDGGLATQKEVLAALRQLPRL